MLREVKAHPLQRHRRHSSAMGHLAALSLTPTGWRAYFYDGPKRSDMHMIPASGSTGDVFLQHARTALNTYSTEIESDPMANSVRRLAIDYFRALEDGGLNVEDMETITRSLLAEGLVRRREDFLGRHPLLSAEQPSAGLRKTLSTIAEQGFEAYSKAVERFGAGIVFTAHPTFALPKELRHSFIESLGPEGTTSSLKKKATSGDFQRTDIALSEEHADAQNAIFNGQQVLSNVRKTILEVAQQHFPTQWRTLKPALLNLASWVGYDLDGRTDIHWGASIYMRLAEKTLQLGRYIEALQELSITAPELDTHLNVLKAAHAHSQTAAELFSGDLTDAETLVQAANFLTDPANDGKLTSLDSIISALQETALSTANDETAEKLILLAAQMRACGLGSARIHLRINAAQISTVLNHELSIESDDDDFGRAVFSQLSDKTHHLTPTTINFADLFQEQMTAKRQFMLCAQILKHIDASTPIRFLIAESENPVTVMGALYLARKYGVDGDVDLSPLFETPEALERGGRFVERLLDDPVYVSYLRKRGRLSLQFGFSDSGRFSSQPAAEMAIERIQNLVAGAMARDGLADIELLLFNTHGESMGRGAYPGAFSKRFDHLLTPWTRQQFEKLGVTHIHEFSFQGGDGFLHFDTQAIALSTVLETAQHVLKPLPDTKDDPFYKRRDISWDLYRSLREWHETLFDNPDYPGALLEFAPGFLVKSGSRKSRRQTGASAGELGLRSLRAIPHNAIMQQLAIPLNVACGFGSAAGNEPDRLVDLLRESDRMKTLAGMAITARIRTSLPAFRAYAAMYDPTFWISVAKRSDRTQAAIYRRIAMLFQKGQTYLSIKRLANTLTIDLARFDRILLETQGHELMAERHKYRVDLHILHAVRQALMMRAFALAANVPSFSKRHGAALSTDSLLEQVTQMQIRETTSMIRDIFPSVSSEHDRLGDLTEPSDSGAKSGEHGYSELETAVIKPLEKIDDVIKDLTIAVCCFYGAYG